MESTGLILKLLIAQKIRLLLRPIEQTSVVATSNNYQINRTSILSRYGLSPFMQQTLQIPTSMSFCSGAEFLVERTTDA